MNKNNGGQAFPSSCQETHLYDGNIIDKILVTTKGMTLRDYFAGQAITGLLSHPEDSIKQISKHTFSQWAYEISDAMLKERERE